MMNRRTKWIEKLPKKAGKILAWGFLIFMTLDMALSGLAMSRYSERHIQGKKAENRMERFLDDHFPDKRIKEIYPHVKIVK